MLVQTSMAVAFSNIRATKAAMKKAPQAKVDAWWNTLQNVHGALRAKVGTIKVNDQINLTFKTFKELRAQDRLPAYMM